VRHNAKCSMERHFEPIFCSIPASAAPLALRFSGLPFPALRPGLFNIGPSALKTDRIRVLRQPRRPLPTCCAGSRHLSEVGGLMSEIPFSKHPLMRPRRTLVHQIPVKTVWRAIMDSF
jgi:hypothetical protein